MFSILKKGRFKDRVFTSLAVLELRDQVLGLKACATTPVEALETQIRSFGRAAYASNQSQLSSPCSLMENMYFGQFLEFMDGEK